ncbi:MAG: alpha-1,4-glucan--maltose-1-phosphate maltosyltransferase [Candidatus Polarisedimenticolia bacterium]
MQEHAAAVPAARGASPRPASPPARPVVESVQPSVDGGRFPVKRVAGDCVRVSAFVHADGHDELAAVVRHRPEEDPDWSESPLVHAGNDRWEGDFVVDRPGWHLFMVQAWVDRFATWQRDLSVRVEAGQDVSVELLAGAALVEEAALRAPPADARALKGWAARLAGGSPVAGRVALAESSDLTGLMARHPDRQATAEAERVLRVRVDRPRAQFGAWYEMFPRSASPEPGRHGTLLDVEHLLPYVAGMGFDVLYLPPIHPIGHAARKGRNNARRAREGDPGSPWAIGAAEGGHRSIHPALGTLDRFRCLIERASAHGLEIAMDIAFQCAPDHPWVEEHPSWFRHAPDGSVRHAENPPKVYEDIYPLDFESADWRALWDELQETILFWAAQGVRIFRVDNPHTKPYAFWEETIERVQRAHPDVIFLSEAFTRPRVMHRLAKAGFSQSYTYFTWRNTPREVRDYFTELRETGALEYLRPSLWPNTPDILTETLQVGGRAAFSGRLVLAATLGASYGLYGPAFELMEGRARGPGQEEYLDSEKYEIRDWDRARPDSLRPLIAHVNRIRRGNPALQSDRRLRFHDVSSEWLLAYSKSTEDLSNIVLVVVNMDVHHPHEGEIELPLEAWGLSPERSFQVHDLLSDRRFLWQGRRAHVRLDPGVMPAQILRLRRHVRTERDFDYYL